MLVQPASKAGTVSAVMAKVTARALRDVESMWVLLSSSRGRREPGIAGWQFAAQRVHVTRPLQWWETLARQYQSEGVEFVPPHLHADARVPRALFDSVADNLIRNALAKRRAERGMRVSVTMDEHGVRVCDTGSAVPVDVARDLLLAPVASAGGLGIGLYQAARQAQASGYRLILETNRDGEVCFALRGSPAGEINASG